MQSTLHKKLHVAMIMDGNGRWAEARQLPRSAGHHAGIEAARRIATAAPDHGVGTLTLYAFSSDNWKRPRPEIDVLMTLLDHYLKTELEEFQRNNIRLTVVGRRCRLPIALARRIDDTEAATASGHSLHLRLAIDYSSRDAILLAASAARRSKTLTRDSFAELLHGSVPVRDVDLLIRTGGEQRLSDFLLWECAYAELLFTPQRWPDFKPADLATAIDEFRSRDRRFGAVPGTAMAVRA